MPRLLKVAGVEAVERHHRLRPLESLEQRFVVVKAEVIAEPHDGSARIAAPAGRGTLLRHGSNVSW